MPKEIYIECARAMNSKIRQEVNGLVRYEIYPEMDAIIFKIKFKDFDFNYGINNVQDLMYNGGTDEAIDILLKKYKKAVLNAFFKTEERKERDRMEGIIA